jgi:hypothetical protein
VPGTPINGSHSDEAGAAIRQCIGQDQNRSGRRISRSLTMISIGRLCSSYDFLHHAGMNCQRIGTAMGPLSPDMITSIISWQMLYAAECSAPVGEPVKPLKLVPGVFLSEAAAHAGRRPLRPSKVVPDTERPWLGSTGQGHSALP